MRIDIQKARFPLTKTEKQTISWLEQNGYEGFMSRQLFSRTEFILRKNGCTRTIAIPQGRAFNVDRLLENVDQQFAGNLT